MFDPDERDLSQELSPHHLIKMEYRLGSKYVYQRFEVRECYHIFTQQIQHTGKIYFRQSDLNMSEKVAERIVSHIVGIYMREAT